MNWIDLQLLLESTKTVFEVEASSLLVSSPILHQSQPRQIQQIFDFEYIDRLGLILRLPICRYINARDNID